MDPEQKEELKMLMVRLADGDRAAFDPMFEALWPIVHRFSARALHGSADAEDAAQVAMMKVFSNISRFDPARDPLSWTLGIAAYECKTLRQKRLRRRETSSSENELSSERASPESEAIARDLEAAILEFSGSLPEGERKALFAHLAGRRPPGDNPTFRKRLSRSLERLRRALGSDSGGD